MRSVPEKLVHSRHRPSGPSETPIGSQSESPGATETPGTTRIFFVGPSNTRRSARYGWLPRLVIPTPLAAAETASETLTASGSFTGSCLGAATGRRCGSSGAQPRRSAALRRNAEVAGRSSPLNPTAPVSSSDEGSAAHPAGYTASSTPVQIRAPRAVAIASRLRASALALDAATVTTGAGG